ncbi:MAG: serpin family protein [Ignavibacteriaceae bacterium]
MKKYSIYLAVILIVFTSLHCKDEFIIPEENNGQHLSASEQKIASSSEIFGFKLFKKISSFQKDSNIFISPISVSMALGMTLNGANKATYDSIKTLLELNGLTGQEINQSFQSLINPLVKLDPKVTFNIANSIWYLNSMTFEQEFINTNKTYFNAEVTGLDFSNPSSVDIINNWVNQNTNGKITEILENIPRDAVMYLINAIYFKADWKYRFDESLTIDGSFTSQDGSNLTCRMMVQSNSFNYLSNDLFQAVDLPYGDSLFSMTIFLPKPEKNIDEVINQFNFENWNKWLNSFIVEEGVISLPKFEISYEDSLNKALISLGMGNAFSPAVADFTRMYSKGGIFISAVRHKTYIKVDEAGTEAAAVTSVEFSRAISGFQMMINRPFIYIIHERTSNTILFIGKMVNPG